MGHLPTTSGSVVFAGKTITHLKPHERSRLGIGLVPQGREIFPDLSVHENLRMGLAAAPKEDRSVIDAVLQDFPRLVRLLDRRGGALSGGEQQLLALARCLCTKPRLILLDEPTEGIQPSIIEEIIETLLALKKRWNMSLIVVEQNLEFITSLSDRVLNIQKGRITEELDRESLLARDAAMHPT
jgi:branched-chain amino acid transport system ATP-binding protein/urea transport system ATP-binding protein